MVIVRLSGGLGNQMFQYAAARRLALVNQAPLKLDLGWFRNIPRGDTHRVYELHVFNSIQEVASAREVRALQGINISGWPKIAKRFLKKTGLLIKTSAVREKFYHFDPEILGLTGDLHLDGYWQSPLYFDDVAEVIRSDFSLKPAPDEANAAMAARIAGVEAVSIHVRRGDYVSNQAIGQYHGSTTLDYYRAAIGEMERRVKSPCFFVFSDDPAWVKDNLRITSPTVYVGHNGPDKGYEDLRLMTLCRHHVIANSSFSWWGAWLAGHAGQLVIAPKKWFNNEAVNTADLIPKGWLRL
ncbi:MAG TPA: alpha-1,2-fucosyltransferase [Geomonas sp.]|nr:alpha-1,2-fucosyltransferase [Geomonas sp.]